MQQWQCRAGCGMCTGPSWHPPPPSSRMPSSAVLLNSFHTRLSSSLLTCIIEPIPMFAPLLCLSFAFLSSCMRGLSTLDHVLACRHSSTISFIHSLFIWSTIPSLSIHIYSLMHLCNHAPTHSPVTQPCTHSTSIYSSMHPPILFSCTHTSMHPQLGFSCNHIVILMHMSDTEAIAMVVAQKLKELAHAGNTELVFEDITADAMGLLLNWLYAGFKASLTLSQAISLFKLSHRFDIAKLQHQCEQTLKASVGLEELPQLEDLADSFHCVQLKEVWTCHAATSWI